MTIAAERPVSQTSPMTSEEMWPVVSADPARVWRWTRDDYHRAADSGLFGDKRVELLDGEILVMAGQKTPHFTSIQLTAEWLEEIFGAGFRVRQQGPLVLSDASEPEPDVAVVVGTIRDYADHHPTPLEIRLLVEVSDATLADDRTKKLTAYAREGIAEYWIVNLVQRQLEVYRKPSPLAGIYGYKAAQILLEGDTVSPLFTGDENKVAVSDIFPPPVP